MAAKRPLPVLLLPGMDGTGELFRGFAAAAPPNFEPIVVRYPNTGSYDDLEKSIQTSIPYDGNFVVVAESFSGPLGVRIAAAYGDRVASLVLCNTFVSSPALRVFAMLPWALLFALPRPMFIVRWRLLGRFATPELLKQIRSILKTTPSRVLAARMRSVLQVNEETAAASLSCPVAYLRGTEDRVIWEQVVTHTLACLPRSRRTDISAPHLLLQTAPEAAWAAIAETVAGGSAG